MKRFMLCLLACLLAAPISLAERRVYADQGGVRVFIEADKAGLLDGAGDVLLPAEYDGIAPFAGDFAIAWQGELAGVVRRDGACVLACEWDAVDIDPGRRRAFARRLYAEDEADDRSELIDLDTGEILMRVVESRDSARIWTDGAYVYRQQYGWSDGWETSGPFRLTIYDSHLDAMMTLDDAESARCLGWCFFIGRETQGGGCALVDLEGNVLADGLLYDCSADGDAVCYTRRIENPVRIWLESAGYGRNRIRRALQRRFGLDEDMTALLTKWLEDAYRCGLLRRDGTRVELPGCAIEPAGDGLYLVNARVIDDYGPVRSFPLPGGLRSEKLYNLLAGMNDRFGYIDGTGAWVVPPVYDFALPFVGGAAVAVGNDGRCRLIDETGKPVGSVRWTGIGEWVECGWKDQRVFAVKTGKGVRLVNRRGEYVGDEVFAGEPIAVNGQPAILADGDGNTCVLDAAGNVVLRVEAENWNRDDAPDGAIWLEIDGKWGLMSVEGDAAGQWRVEPTYRSVGHDAEHCLAILKTPSADDARRYVWLYLGDDGKPVGRRPMDAEYSRWLATIDDMDDDEAREIMSDFLAVG